MKLNKEKFLKSELGSSLKECITDWDKSLEELECRHRYTEEYGRLMKECYCCKGQWEVYQKVIRQFYGIEYFFSRTDEYFGLTTEDETDWLFKIEKEKLKS